MRRLEPTAPSSGRSSVNKSFGPDEDGDSAKVVDALTGTELLPNSKRQTLDQTLRNFQFVIELKKQTMFNLIIALP